MMRGDARITASARTSTGRGSGAVCVACTQDGDSVKAIFHIPAWQVSPCSCRVFSGTLRRGRSLPRPELGGKRKESHGKGTSVSELHIRGWEALRPMIDHMSSVAGVPN